MKKKADWETKILEIPYTIDVYIDILKIIRAGMFYTYNDYLKKSLDELIDQLHRVNCDINEFADFITMSYPITSPNDIEDFDLPTCTVSNILNTIKSAGQFRVNFVGDSEELYSEEINIVTENIDSLKRVLWDTKFHVESMLTDLYHLHKDDGDVDEMQDILEKAREDINFYINKDTSYRNEVLSTLSYLIHNLKEGLYKEADNEA